MLWGGGGEGGEGIPRVHTVSVAHWCHMAEFRAAGPKNGPAKFLAALEVSGLESGPIPNFLIAA